jgi:hypothetical protein
LSIHYFFHLDNNHRLNHVSPLQINTASSITIEPAKLNENRQSQAGKKLFNNNTRIVSTNDPIFEGA